MEKATPKKETERIGKTKKYKSKARKSHSKEELNQRRMKEYELVLLGESQKNIANVFGIDIRTVEKDIQIVREEGGKKYGLQNMLGKLYDYNERSKQRLKRLWTIVVDKKSTKDEVIKAIREIRKEDIEAVKREQIAGILPKETSPLISIDAKSEEGNAENKVVINIIAPEEKVKKAKVVNSKKDK